MPDNEANDTAHQSPPQYAWNEEREAQLNAPRISAQTSTDDLIKYLRLRAERAGIKSYFLRAETAYLQKMAEAASERLPGDDPKVWQAEQDLGWTRFDWIYREKAFHKQQSLLNLAKNYFETPAERRMFGESEFRALGNELSDLIEMQSGRLSEFSSIDPDKPALPALLEERVARMKSGSTFQERIGTHLGGAIVGNDEAISWVADRWQGLPPEHRERASRPGAPSIKRSSLPARALAGLPKRFGVVSSCSGTRRVLSRMRAIFSIQSNVCVEWRYRLSH